MAAQSPNLAKDLPLVAWMELNHLRTLRLLPESLERTPIALDRRTPVYDLNGQLLFWRIPLGEARGKGGYVDIAAHPAVGDPYIASGSGAAWDADALLKTGTRAARALGVKEGIEARFVAYSFPKLGLQFLAQGKELVLLELFTWVPVPPSTRSDRYETPSNFERWSFLDEMPDDQRAEREERYMSRINRWRRGPKINVRDLATIDSALFQERLKITDRIKLVETRELHYSSRGTDHVPCYELRGQETNVWCVAASVQMVLDFYRYEYTQVRVAQELCLGTLANPIGLPYSRDGDVVVALESLSRNALVANMNTSPTFTEFVSEVNQNRPLISFIPGHSRTVAGYTRSFLSLIGQPPFQGLLVYDPWPPNAGVITRWENFNTSSYRRTFTAAVQRA